MHLLWHTNAQKDRLRIMDAIADDNPDAAIALDEDFRDKARRAAQNPRIYKQCRYQGTREIVIRPNYVMVYRILQDSVEILRIIHARRLWP